MAALWLPCPWWTTPFGRSVGEEDEALLGLVQWNAFKAKGKFNEVEWSPMFESSALQAAKIWTKKDTLLQCCIYLFHKKAELAYHSTASCEGFVPERYWLACTIKDRALVWCHWSGTGYIAAVNKAWHTSRGVVCIRCRPRKFDLS